MLVLDRNNGGNICKNYGKAIVINEGLVEIGKGSNCDFGALPVASYTSTTYRQTKGETVVNGILGAHVLELQGGTLSGTGTILRMPEQFNMAGVTVSPGTTASPFGKLTLTPEGNDLIFTEGTIELELGGAYPAHDQLHVAGDAYFVGVTTIKVSLRDGFFPKAGDSFTVISANFVGDHAGGVASRFELPALSSGLNWQVVNDGTTVKLNVQ